MTRAIPIILALALSGCGGTNRWDAYQATRVAEEQTAKAALAKPSPTITVTTMDSAGRPVTVTADLAPIIQAVTGNRAGSNRSALPKGAVAEAIDSIGRAGREILTTPAAVGGVVAAGVAGALRETGGGSVSTSVGGDQVGGDYSPTTTTTETPVDTE